MFLGVICVVAQLENEKRSCPIVLCMSASISVAVDNFIITVSEAGQHITRPHGSVSTPVSGEYTVCFSALRLPWCPQMLFTIMLEPLLQGHG
jgi:hypothetical protein